MASKRMQIQTKRRRIKKKISAATLLHLLVHCFYSSAPRTHPPIIRRCFTERAFRSHRGESLMVVPGKKKSLCAEGRKEEERITPRARTNTWRRLTTQEVASPGGDSPDRILFPSARQRTDDKREGMTPLLPVQTIKIKTRRCTGRHEVLCESCKTVSYFRTITRIYVYNYQTPAYLRILEVSVNNLNQLKTHGTFQKAGD